MTQTPQDFTKLFAYTWWANAKLLETVALLTPEEFARPVGGSFGSVQGTLAHVYGADWVWLERWHGGSPRALPAAEAVPDVQSAEEEAGSRSRLRRRVFSRRLTPERLQETLTYVNFAGETCSYPMHAALLHLTNHATYHRGQVVTLLRQLGEVSRLDGLPPLHRRGRLARIASRAEA